MTGRPVATFSAFSASLASSETSPWGARGRGDQPSPVLLRAIVLGGLPFSACVWSAPDAPGIRTARGREWEKDGVWARLLVGVARLTVKRVELQSNALAYTQAHRSHLDV